MHEPLGTEHLDEPIFAHLRRDFVALTAGLTVGQALETLRRQACTLLFYFNLAGWLLG